MYLEKKVAPIHLTLLHSGNRGDSFPWILLKAGTLKAQLQAESYARTGDFAKLFAGLFGNQPTATTWPDKLVYNYASEGEFIEPGGLEEYNTIAMAIREGKFEINRDPTGIFVHDEELSISGDANEGPQQERNSKKTDREIDEDIGRLKHADPEVRLAAIDKLGEEREVRAVDALLHVINHDVEPNCRAAAAWALGRLGDLSALETLRPVALEDPSEHVRREASAAVLKLR